MCSPAMPKEYLEIARLSDEFIAKREADHGTRSDMDMWDEYRDICRPLHVALSNLTDELLKQLIGWITFGRDCTGVENASEELAWYISETSVANREGAIGYIMDKPIHAYLRRAEEYLQLPPQL